ncbi:MAG: hypothetical protein ACKO2G_06690 [Verrucomicrobiales bacterium]
MKVETIPQLLFHGRSLANGGAALCRDREMALDHDALHAMLVKAGADLNALGIGRATRVMTPCPTIR